MATTGFLRDSRGRFVTRGGAASTSSSTDDIERGADAMERLADAEERAVRAAQAAIGPFQRLERLQAQLGRARADGVTGAPMMDLEYLVGRAQERVNRIAAPPPSTLMRVAQFALDSRVHLGGGNLGVMLPRIASLIGQSGGAAALGGGGTALGAGGGALGAAGVRGAALLANPAVAGIALVGSAAAAAAAAIYKLADEAARSGRELTALRTATGSSSGDASLLATYSRAFGADFGAMAGGLNDRINSDPLARAFASRFGASSMPGPYGTMDTGANLLKVVEGLRTVEDPRERLRIARTLGVEGALPLTMVSDRTMSRLQADAMGGAAIRDPEFERKSAEFLAAQQRAAQVTRDLKDMIGKAVMDPVTWVLNTYSDMGQGLIALLTGQQTPFGAPGSGRAAQPGAAGLGADSYNPLAANTDALQNNTIALARLSGMLGGGDRARDALPPGLNGASLVQAREYEVLKWGTL